MAERNLRNTALSEQLQEQPSYDSAFASLFPIQISQQASFGAKEKLDFASLISQLSVCHRAGVLPWFPSVNFNGHELDERPLGAGSVFVVKAHQVYQNAPSPIQGGIVDTTERLIASKSTESIFDSKGQTLPYQQPTLRAFIKEVQILTHLRRHPNVINLLGIGWHFEQFTPFPTAQPRLILEYVTFTLRTFIKEKAPTVRTQLKLLSDVSCGLRALHSAGIVHGDLKPDNILIAEQTVLNPVGVIPYIAKIADFSHALIQSLMGPIQIIGTHGYMAPEVIRQETLQFPHAADIYSFGVTYWQVLSNFEKLPIMEGVSLCGN
jgi:serine/threonine protein kinase